MMSCREVSELVSRSLDEKLPLIVRLKVRVHLLMCRMCATFARRVRQLREQLSSGRIAPESVLDASLPAATRERLKQLLKNRPA